MIAGMQSHACGRNISEPKIILDARRLSHLEKEHAVLTTRREKMDKQPAVIHNATLLMEKVQGPAKFA